MRLGVFFAELETLAVEQGLQADRQVGVEESKFLERQRLQGPLGGFDVLARGVVD